jgi:hypothetical protein
MYALSLKCAFVGQTWKGSSCCKNFGHQAREPNLHIPLNLPLLPQQFAFLPIPTATTPAALNQQQIRPPLALLHRSPSIMADLDP